jgi:hypothetical protein
MRAVRWAVGVTGTLVIAALCLINPWLLLAVLGIPILVWMLRSNSFSNRTRIIIASVVVAGAVVVGLALVLFTASGPGVGNGVAVSATYEATGRYASADETWELEEQIIIARSSVRDVEAGAKDRKRLLGLFRKEFDSGGWDLRAADEQLVFRRSARQTTDLDWWPLSSVHVISIEVPLERTLEFDEASGITLIAPRHMVAETFPPGSDPVDRLQNSEEQTVVGLANLEDDNEVRLKVLSPLARNPLGVRLVEVASNGIAWAIVLALLGVVTAMIRKEVEATVASAVGKLTKRPRQAMLKKR